MSDSVHTAPVPTGACNSSDDVEVAILDFDTYLSVHSSTLNTQGIWLFLATLGCWSVSTWWLQAFALVVTVSMSVLSVLETKHDVRTFPQRLRALEEQTEAHVTDVRDKKACLYDIAALRTKTSVWYQFKKTPKFVMSFVFLGATALHFILSIPHK